MKALSPLIAAIVLVLLAILLGAVLGHGAAACHPANCGMVFR